jgi:hypothetical protein
MSFFGDLFNPQQGATTTTTAPSFTLGPWQRYVSQLDSLTQSPLQTYNGPTVAPFNQAQQNALGMGMNLAMNGTPAYNTSLAQIQAQASGANTANPYAVTMNPFGGPDPYATAQNPYMGDNPYLQHALDAMNQDTADVYRRTIAPQTDAASVYSGAYGGSGYQQQVANNQLGLARALSQNEANVRMGNYNNSANLFEQGAQRGMGGFNTQAQLAENQLNRSTNAFQQGLDNALQASQLGLQSQGTDLQAIGAMNQLGQGYNGYQQQLLDAMQNQFTQNQQAPFTTLDLLGNGLSRASGGQGSVSQMLPGASPLTTGLGLLGIFSQLVGG